MSLNDAVAAYSFDSSLLTDDSGTGNTLTNFDGGGGGVTSVPGLLGSAAKFAAATNDCLFRNSNASFVMSGSFTLVFWMKTTGSPTFYITKDDIGSNREYGFFSPGAGKPSFYVFDSLGGFVEADWGSATNDGNWHLVIGWYDSGLQKIFISVDDGAAVSTNNPNGITAASSAFVIGNTGAFSNAYSNDGLIDEVLVYKHVLTAGERTQLYNGGAGFNPYALPAAPTNLVATATSSNIGLTWDATPSATSYSIYRGTVSGGESLLVAGNVPNSYTDSTAVPGTTYYYKVTATNGAGEGPKSNEASATVPVPTPSGGGGGFVPWFEREALERMRQRRPEDPVRPKEDDTERLRREEQDAQDKIENDEEEAVILAVMQSWMTSRAKPV